MSFKQASCQRVSQSSGSEIFWGWLPAVLRRFFTPGATIQKRIRIVDSCGDVFSDAGANPAASTFFDLFRGGGSPRNKLINADRAARPTPPAKAGTLTRPQC